jgi:hypothetical protein
LKEEPIGSGVDIFLEASSKIVERFCRGQQERLSGGSITVGLMVGRGLAIEQKHGAEGDSEDRKAG